MTNNIAMVSLPLALARGLAYPGDDFHELVDQLQALLAAPAEDVRAVVDEPVGVIVIKKWLVENPASVSLKTNDLPNGAGLYLAPPADPELNAITLQLLRQAKDIPDGLYARAKALANDNRHPQRPVVMPEPEAFERLVIDHYGFGSSQLCLLSGKDLKIMFDACLDEFGRLNPEILK